MKCQAANDGHATALECLRFIALLSLRDQTFGVGDVGWVQFPLQPRGGCPEELVQVLLPLRYWAEQQAH